MIFDIHYAQKLNQPHAFRQTNIAATPLFLPAYGAYQISLTALLSNNKDSNKRPNFRFLGNTWFLRNHLIFLCLQVCIDVRGMKPRVCSSKGMLAFHMTQPCKVNSSYSKSILMFNHDYLQLNSVDDQVTIPRRLYRSRGSVSDIRFKSTNIEFLRV